MRDAGKAALLQHVDLMLSCRRGQLDAEACSNFNFERNIAVTHCMA